MDLQSLLNKAKVKASELNPYLKDKCLELVELAYKNGFQIAITQGYRSIDEQNSLYAQGRTKPGQIVTNAKGGSSNHNYRIAFDIAVLNPDGSYDWNTTSKYNAIGKMGQSIGLDWGGAWKDFVDLPHFEYTYGLSISQLKNGATIPNYPQGYTAKKEVSQVSNTIVKERIYAENGVLKRADGNYKIPATDVRYIKFNKGTYKLKLVWAKGKTVSQLVKESGADYGFNFPFFYNDNPIADCKIANTILNTGYDNPNGAKQTKWHGFAYKNGQPMLGMFNVNDDFGSDGFLVKTTPMLVEDGKACWDWYREQEGTAKDIGRDSNGVLVRAQRTFVGLDTQGNLHLAVGDGRTTYDRGLTLEEMALYMSSKGVINALNGDGGSSSVIADKTGSLGQNQGTEERAVNHAVLIFFNPIVVPPVPPTPTQGGSTVEQWKLDTLKWVSQQTQKDGSPFIDYDTWKDKLDTNTPVWLLLELVKRILEKQ